MVAGGRLCAGRFPQPEFHRAFAFFKEIAAFFLDGEGGEIIRQFVAAVEGVEAAASESLFGGVAAGIAVARDVDDVFTGAELEIQEEDTAGRKELMERLEAAAKFCLGEMIETRTGPDAVEDGRVYMGWSGRRRGAT